MSFWFTLKSIFRTQEQPQTRLTISIAWPDGSGAFDYPVSLPEFAVNMLEAGRLPERVAIWKRYERHADGGAESMDRQLCHLLCFHLSQFPDSDGSPEPRPAVSARLQ